MMAKKRSLFNFLKRFFIQPANSRSDKKDKRKRWVFGRFKNKSLPSISAPSRSSKTTLDQGEEEKQGNAAETADASQMKLISSCCSPQSFDETTKKFDEIVQSCLSLTTPRSYQCEMEIQNLAATKIQSAFRGYLARKALRALKGVVRLQAIIRGWSVRRQAMNALKCLQTIVNIQTEFCAKRGDFDLVKLNQEHKLEESIEKDIKIDTNSQKRLDESLLLNSHRRWDDSVLSKEEANAISMSKRVAAIKRERVREYWLNNRRSAESEQRWNVRQRYWLEQWVDAQLTKREDVQNLEAEFCSTTITNKQELSERRLKLKNLQKYYQVEGFDSPAMNVTRRSFHTRKHSMAEGNTMMASSAVPTYMAATESAKAKARSFSSPRLRPNVDVYSEINSPYKHKLSPISSINSEMTCNSVIIRPNVFSQISPSFKGLGGTVKAKRYLKDFKLSEE